MAEVCREKLHEKNMNTVVINIMDEVNVHIQEVELTDRRKLVNSVKYFLPHARYSPAFKLGRWDGCARFCTLGGKTYLNALDKLLPILVDAGYDVEIVDDRHKHDLDLTAIDDTYLSDRMWPPGHRAQGEPIVLRDYQVQLVNECLAHPQGLIIAPTSSGKTIVTATLSRRVEHIGRTIVIVPNKNLVEQTLEDYQNVGLNVGVIFGDRKEFDRQHTICTWQSLNVLDKKNKDALDNDQLAVFLDQQVAVIVDEAHSIRDLGVLHRLLTTTFSNIPIRWGLTGTVPEAEYNQMSLFTALGPLIGQLQARDLQDAGHLAQCQVHVHQTQETQVYRDYQSELKFLLTNPERLKWVSDFVKTISAQGNTLVLVDRIATGTALHELIPHSTFISGEMKSSDRRTHYKEINLSDNAVMIATYGTTSTGISINRLFNLVLIEPGKSFVRVIQSIGRGLRKADDKDHVDIYDICSKMKFSHRHMLKRQQHYKKVQYPHALTKENY
jgi:superfamily II DNA or RNA helicase